MSRNEGRIESEGTAIDASDILAALESDRKSGEGKRREAFTRYLAVAEDWKSASGLLDGAFARRDRREG